MSNDFDGRLYEDYSYIYPPRAQVKIAPEQAAKYDTGLYIAQPKYNGSCVLVFLNDDAGFLKVMNRHNETKTGVDFTNVDFKGAYRGTGWLVLAGEYLDKAKKGESGEPFNHKFIIWDILVCNSVHLIGSTVEMRMLLLSKLYGDNRMIVTENGIATYNHICPTAHAGIYKAPCYTSGFDNLYREISKIDLYEGLVLKRAKAPLTFGFTEANNHAWQLKIRKPTKNYTF